MSAMKEEEEGNMGHSATMAGWDAAGSSVDIVCVSGGEGGGDVFGGGVAGPADGVHTCR